jgi:hypothetical protein
MRQVTDGLPFRLDPVENDVDRLAARFRARSDVEQRAAIAGFAGEVKDMAGRRRTPRRKGFPLAFRFRSQHQNFAFEQDPHSASH